MRWFIQDYMNETRIISKWNNTIRIYHWK